MEKPIEPGNSWFSAKSIEVERELMGVGGRALHGCGRPKAVPNPRKLRIPAPLFCRQTWGAKVLVSRGKEPRSSAKVPKGLLSEKGSTGAMTTSRWAWKQPSFKESVIAHWSSPRAPKMKRDSSNIPKPRLQGVSTAGSTPSRGQCGTSAIILH